MYHGSLVVLDAVNYKNSMQRTAWHRFFYNEKNSIPLKEFV